MDLQRTPHALTRQAERSVRDESVEAVLQWGREIPQGQGRVAYYLGRLEVANAATAGFNLRPHCNLLVCLAQDGAVLTVARASSPRRAERFAQRHQRNARGRRRCRTEG